MVYHYAKNLTILTPKISQFYQGAKNKKQFFCFIGHTDTQTESNTDNNHLLVEWSSDQQGTASDFR